MFRKYYKAANDDIVPNRKIIDAVFEKTENEKENSAKIYTLGRRYGTLAAAVIVLLLSAYIYPQLNESNKEVNSQPKTNLVRGLNSEIKGKQSIVAQETEKLHKTAEKFNNEKDSETDEVEVSTAATVNNAKEIQDFKIPEDEGDSSVARTVDESVSYEIVTDQIMAVSEDEIADITHFLKTQFGEKDEATQNEYIFEIVGKANCFYVGRWRWRVAEHSSLLTEFVLDEEFTKMYEFEYAENGNIKWNTENNLLD